MSLQLSLFGFGPGVKVYTTDGFKYGIITSETKKKDVFWVSYLEYNGDNIRCDWCYHIDDLQLFPVCPKADL